MPLQSTSGAASYDAFGGGVAAVPKYIEDYFSTYLVTGDGTAPAVNNGIDLSTKGGLVWIKKRSAAGSHSLFDTARGANLRLISNDTAAQDSVNLSFTTTGFSNYTLDSGVTYASWSWAKAPKFFDVVTFTTNSSNGATFAHNLGSVPGCLIVKSLASADSWIVWHRGLTGGIDTNVLVLNATNGQFSIGTTTTATSTTITIGNGSLSFQNAPYVAYLFAHNAGGFGLTGTDNVISCGSFTTGNSGKITAPVNLGYEAQWLLAKNVDSAENWVMYDIMRGMNNTGYAALNPNTSGAEYTGTSAISPTATGFDTPNASGPFASFANYIYIAIRRGPMKVPTSGTSVFSPVAQTNTGSQPFPVTAGFPVDSAWFGQRNGWGVNFITSDRLRGATNLLLTTSTNSEATNNSTYGPSVSRLDSNTQFKDGMTNASEPDIYWMMQRAPSFFDEVCWSGAGANLVINHNLQAVPELIINKYRNGTSYGWATTAAGLVNPNTNYLTLNNSNAEANSGASPGFIYDRTSTTFTVSSDLAQSGFNWVSYLFASCPGVSKVGSYTGTATTKQIDCGFTGGARFVLIKKTSGTGSWYVWDSARGIVSGNDPYLLLNSTAAEVTSTDYIDTYSAGFEISSTAPSEINENGGSFIFLAISQT